jgi:hypothetical protein
MTDDPIVALLGCGILSPIFDRPVDVRKPLRLSDEGFDSLIRDLWDRGLIATDAAENGYTH